jgi:glycosyltransferase involved in cell wall biosynthesis
MRKKILVVGPALSRSGYGEQCRFALRALRAHEDRFDIFLKNINWGQTGWVVDFSDERQWLDELLLKTTQYMEQKGPFDISLQVTIPNEWQKIAPVNIGYTAGIECDRIAPIWIEKSNLMDRILVVSNHAKQGFEQTSYNATNRESGESFLFKNTTPVTVANYPVRTPDPVDIDIKLDTKFNFLTMAQWGPRKNMENTIRGFVEEFIDQDVGLVLKANIRNNSLSDRRASTARLEGLLSEYPERKCKVYLLHGDMSEGEIASLFKHPQIDAFITLTHGEGFGLPIFEAAYNGLPVISPDWSGQLDFLYKMTTTKRNGKTKTKNRAMFAAVDYEMQPVQPEAVWDGVIQAEAMWCFPKQGHYKARLREIYKDHGRFKKQAKELQKYLIKTFTPEAQYKIFSDVVCPAEEYDVENWLSELGAQVHD